MNIDYWWRQLEIENVWFMYTYFKGYREDCQYIYIPRKTPRYAGNPSDLHIYMNIYVGYFYSNLSVLVKIVKVSCRLKVLQMHIVRKKNRLYVSIKMHNQIQRSRDLFTWVDDWWPLITWLSYYFYLYNNTAINFTISIKKQNNERVG